MSLSKRLRKPLISLAVLLLMIPVGEVLVRVFTNTHPPLVIRDAELGRRYVPSYAGLVFDVESEREIFVRTNSDGFRGPQYDFEAPPGTRRIAIIGDSMVAGLSVEESQTFCGLLEEHLQAAHPSVAWQVMNFGVLGSSTGQECLIYEKVVSRYSPDLVLCAFYSGNDLADNSHQLTSNPRIYFDFDEDGGLVQLPFSASRTTASKWLNMNSRLYVWQKQLLRGSKIGRTVAGPSLRQSDWVFCAEPPKTVAHAWRVTAALLERFQRSVTEDGANFGIVHLPCGKQVFADAFAGVVERAGDHGRAFVRGHPDGKLKEICADLDTRLISITDALRAATPSDSIQVKEEWVFYGGGGHFNERGHAIAAEALFRGLSSAEGSEPALIEALLGFE